MKLVLVPSKILYTSVAPVSCFDQQLKKIVKQMGRVLLACKDPIGVGLAANQVGLDMQIFIMRPQESDPISVYINPHITHRDDTLTIVEPDCALEGCLSIPRIWGPIQRNTRITLQYQDISGAVHEKIFDNFEATIVQHEVDHLHGVLFTHRSIEQKQKIYEERLGKLQEITLT